MKYLIIIYIIALALTSKSNPNYSNAKEIYNFFKSRGWTTNAICGMLGNMHWESDGLEPDINEMGGGGYGLAQWTPGTKLKTWAQERNLNYRTVNTQCQRIQYELDNRIQYYKKKCSYNSFKAFSQSSDSVDTLTRCFMTEYERPNEYYAHLNERIHYGNFWYNYFSGSHPQPTPTKDVVFTYAVKINDGRILPEVRNDENYAGIQGKAITGVAIKVNRGSVRYRVHVKGGNWLGYVTGYNWNDYNNGYAGNGKPIDLVQIIYSENSQQPLYRVSPLNSNYYSWQRGDKVGYGYDGYAGASGKTIDRLQIKPN